MDGTFVKSKPEYGLIPFVYAIEFPVRYSNSVVEVPPPLVET